jgi:Secretion system C-terminal sorting domain
MKKTFNFLISFFLFLNAANILGQTPNLGTPKLFGGTKEDGFQAVIPTFDRGYIAIGYTWSNDFDAIGSKGGSDFFIVKMNASDQMEWKKVLGGAGFETGFSVRQTLDSGYIVAGDTYFSANTGDVGASKGNIDAWVLKLNKTGGIVWKRSYGGSESEGFAAIELTADDGILAVGYTASDNGDVSNNKGGDSDAWVVRLNADGSIKWQKTFGGSKKDEFYDVVKVGAFWILVGFTDSQDGDITDPKGGQDGWALRISDEGSVIWKKNYGGSDFEGFNSVKTVRIVDTNYVVVTGASVSNNGDVSNNHGGFDAWMLRLNYLNGQIEWSKLYGGTKDDRFNDLVYNQNALYCVGYTESNDGDIKRPYQGGGDVWLVKTKFMDGMLWGEQCFGGTQKDAANSIAITPNNFQFIIAGATKSTDNYFGNATNRGGVSDGFITRAFSIVDAVDDMKFNNAIKIYPNPTNSELTIDCEEILKEVGEAPSVFNRFLVVDALGKTVFSDKESNNTFSIPTKDLPNGLYFLRIESKGSVLAMKKFMVQH